MVSTHAVVAGETLSALALRFYGDAELYRLIAAASGIADPDVVNVGQPPYIRLSPPSMASPILASSTSGRYWSYSSGVATGSA